MKIRKILTALVCAAMLFSLLPAGVFAAGTDVEIIKIGEDGEPLKSDGIGWRYMPSGELTLNEGYTFTLDGYAFTGTTTNKGTVTGGLFGGDVTNSGTISGGIFTGTVTTSARGTITGGIFTYADPVGTLPTVDIYNGTIDDAQSAYAWVVPGTTVNITADIVSSSSFVKWSSDDVTLDDPSSRQTSFVMPDKNVTILANSDYAMLSDLKLSAGTLDPVFDSNQFDYTASVANDVSQITVTPTVSYESAEIYINGTKVQSASESDAIALDVGENTIVVKVVAPDFGELTYTVVVTRADAEVIPSNPAEDSSTGTGTTETASTSSISPATGVYTETGVIPAALILAVAALGTIVLVSRSRKADR
ncbi:MAG: cadherin-like beta sandwich domain-containing protein [Eubacteriaceae bacterium]